MTIIREIVIFNNFDNIFFNNWNKIENYIINLYTYYWTYDSLTIKSTQFEFYLVIQHESLIWDG